MLTERFDATRMLSEFLLDVGLMLAIAYVALGPFSLRMMKRRAGHGPG